MTREELSQLIPFYVANTLSDEERKLVEQELGRSPELQEELHFWQQTSEASRLQAKFAAQGHPTSAELVDYAERTLTDNKRRLDIERHVQACAVCSEAYSLLRELEPVPVPSQPRLVERFAQFIKSFRLVYVVPALVVTALLLLFIVPPMLRSPEEMQLLLSYNPETRTRESVNIPILMLKDETEKVNVTAVVPHNAEDRATYNIHLRPGGGEQVLIVRFVKPYYRGVPNDSLRFTLDAEKLSVVGMNYDIVISEEPSSVGGTPLPPYTIPFKTERSK